MVEWARNVPMANSSQRYNKQPLPDRISAQWQRDILLTVTKFQEDLDQWLHYYNYERPHRGYRNMGRRPIETIEKGKVIKERLYNEQAA